MAPFSKRLAETAGLNRKKTVLHVKAPLSSKRGSANLARLRRHLLYTWCLTSTETIRLIRDGEKGGDGMEVGGEGDYYIPIATLSPPE